MQYAAPEIQGGVAGVSYTYTAPETQFQGGISVSSPEIQVQGGMQYAAPEIQGDVGGSYTYTTPEIQVQGGLSVASPEIQVQGGMQYAAPEIQGDVAGVSFTYTTPEIQVQGGLCGSNLQSYSAMPGMRGAPIEERARATQQLKGGVSGDGIIFEEGQFTSGFAGSGVGSNLRPYSASTEMRVAPMEERSLWKPEQ